MSTPETRGNTLQGLKNSPLGAGKGRHYEKWPVKSRHLKTINSLRQLAASYSEHPLVSFMTNRKQTQF